MPNIYENMPVPSGAVPQPNVVLPSPEVQKKMAENAGKAGYDVFGNSTIPYRNSSPAMPGQPAREYTSFSSDKTQEIADNNRTISSMNNAPRGEVNITGFQQYANGTYLPAPEGAIQDETGVWNYGGKRYLSAPSAGEDPSVVADKKLIADSQAKADVLMQDTLASIQRQYENLIATQKDVNMRNEASLGQTLLQSGASRYSASATGIQSGLASYGMKKVSELIDQENQAINNAKVAYQEGNDKRVAEQLAIAKEARTSQQNAANDLMNKLVQANKDIRDYSYKANQDAVSNKLASEKFSYEQKQDAIENALAEKKITSDQANSLRDYALKLQQLEQGKYIVTTDVFGNPTAFNTKTGKFENSVLPPPPSTSPSSESVPSSGGDKKAPVPIDPYIDALYNALKGSSKDTQQTTMGQVRQQLASGDKERAKDTILRVAVKNAGVDIQAQVIARNFAVSQLNEIKTLLNAYVAKTGDTNVITGTLEKALEKIGLTKDPALASLKNKIDTNIQVYRRSMTGVAFSPSESQEYKDILPSIDNINDLNVAKIDTLVDTFNKNNKAVVGLLVGQKNYDAIFGKVDDENVAKSKVIDYGKTHPEEQPKIQGGINAYKQKYGKAPTYSQLLQAFPEIQ